MDKLTTWNTSKQSSYPTQINQQEYSMLIYPNEILQFKIYPTKPHEIKSHNITSYVEINKNTLWCFQILQSFIDPKWECCSNKLLQDSQEQWVRWQNGKSKKMGVRWNFSIVTLTQRMVNWEWGEGSIYTWRGKPTSLGSMPSVHHQT